MLVLTRKRNEEIVLDGDIKVTVIDIRGDRVRLGIDAPEHIAIRRAELPPEAVKRLREGKESA
jgi:carbon storage regulator